MTQLPKKHPNARADQEVRNKRRDRRRPRGLYSAPPGRQHPLLCLDHHLFSDRQRSGLDDARFMVRHATDQRAGNQSQQARGGVLGACRRFHQWSGSGRRLEAKRGIIIAASAQPGIRLVSGSGPCWL